MLLGAKVLGAVSVTLLLCSVTPAHKIFHALRRMHVPRGWVEIAMLMYRYIFSLLDHASEGAAAQRLRLGYAGVRRSVASLGTLAGTVLVRSFDQARQTHDAMTLRGYTGDFPFAPVAPGNGHWWKTATACTVIFMVYLLLEWGPV
jgi:cobalt/nickel transport system permease protein